MSQWMPVSGSRGTRVVSDKGDVLRLERRSGEWVPAVPTHNNGYVQIRMFGRNHSIHRLVATAFIPNPLGLPVVNHLNAVRDDNRIENLEWTDCRGNLLHAFSLGRGAFGERHHKAVLSREQVDEIIAEAAARPANKAEMARRYGCSRSNIGFILRKQTWQH